MTTETRSLHGLIGASYDALSPVDRRLADLILNFPAGLVGYSASELARMASTSNAAVSRFVRRLGFANFDEMRRKAREEAESGTPVYLLGRSDIDADGDVLDRHATTAMENIRQTAAGIERKQFREFTDRVRTARRVWIVGFRHGFAIATYLRWSLLHARDDVRLVTFAGDTFGEHLVDLNAEDILIVMAMRRRVPAIFKLTRLARDKGAQIALILDPGAVDGQIATWVFRIASHAQGPIDDHAAALMFAHAITEQVIAAVGPSARDRFAQIDAIHENLGEL
jgi:DNA-binding MurR/RpiR family transcriptional regulator